MLKHVGILQIRTKTAYHMFSEKEEQNIKTSVFWVRPKRQTPKTLVSKYYCGQNKKDMNHPTFLLK